MLSTHEVERLARACETAAESATAFSRGIDDFNATAEGLPAVARPIVKRDFEANTGMNADEWKVFLGKLNARYVAIQEAATRLAQALAQGANETDINAATTALKEVATPLIGGTIAAIKAMATIEAYLEGLPAKINMIPESFMETGVRDELVDSVPAYIERAEALKTLLEETDVQLHAIIE
ncbi:MAG: hypothetical protein LUP95_04040 [Euryarchaeota archaeon]|nr:hypothetical protein [Euryarchaeota archaeon]